VTKTEQIKTFKSQKIKQVISNHATYASVRNMPLSVASFCGQFKIKLFIKAYYATS